MRAVVAAVAVLAILASPHGLEAFLPGEPGPVHEPSPIGPAPPSPHLFPAAAGDRTRSALPPGLIVEVYYFAARDDEYIAVANPASSALDLSGWRLTDREGSIDFPAGSSVAGGSRVVVSRNATSYTEDTLDAADFTYGPGSATPMVVAGRIPQLNNDGDEVLLLNATGAVVDAFVYGASPYAGEGWNGPAAERIPKGNRAVRSREAGVYRDTDTDADWNSLRRYGLGQSDLPFRSFEIRGLATAFLSPDDSLEVLEGLLDRATASIHAGLYTLTNPVLGESLRAAAARDVDVSIFLEGGPVGGIDEREWVLASRIAASGASVRFLVDDYANGTLARYRFLHAKYAVIDARTVVVGSENWGEHGFPDRGRTGNRGWQVAMDDPALAAYLGDVFLQDADARRRDSIPLAQYSPNLYRSNDTASNDTYRFSIPSAHLDGTVLVTPVVAPDHSLRDDSIVALLRSATQGLDIEAFYISREWGEHPNLYLEAAIEASRHGVRVRILLDGTWYNVEGDDPVDNDDTVAYVNGIARREGLPLEAKIADSKGHGLSKVHNKGVLVDGRVAFVSSLNWNRNAVTNNREVGLIIEGGELVEPFRLAFEHDWSDDVGRRDDPQRILSNPLLLPLITLLVVNVALLVAWRRRRRGKGLSEEEPTQ